MSGRENITPARYIDTHAMNLHSCDRGQCMLFYSHYTRQFLLRNSLLLPLIDLVWDFYVLSNVRQLFLWQWGRPLRSATIQVDEPGTLLFGDDNSVAFRAVQKGR